MQNVGQSLVLIPIVQMPPFRVVIGQPRIGARGGHVSVEQCRPGWVIRRINHGKPVIDHAADKRMVAWKRREIHGHSKLAGPFEDAGAVHWEIIGQ
ncbi:hypothetical protein ACT3TS_19590 [Specibacter sp. AOP5-B1-6]|uniref:hypothetical protein n=1 Tax=Specibacter sp. AOP5-B1-6 TaxID=3457653 RepID=UPI00402B82BA